MNETSVQTSRRELEVLRSLAEAAGQVIMEIYGNPTTTWTKDDQSPLTEADLRSDQIIRAGLEAAFPGVFILSEESTSAAADTPDYFFLVDPLDGTKEFLRRNGEFTVNIALIHDGKPLAGVVAAPALKEMFWAGPGLGAWMSRSSEERPLQSRLIPDQANWRIVGSRSHGSQQMSEWLKGVPAHTCVGIGSALKFCRVAEGLADIYPRFGPTSQWDTAAGQCVLEAAGGEVFGPDQMPLRYGLDRPILNPHFIALGDRRIKSMLPSFS